MARAPPVPVLTADRVPGCLFEHQEAFKVFDDVEFNKAFLSLGADKGLVGASLFYVAPSSYDMRISAASRPPIPSMPARASSI